MPYIQPIYDRTLADTIYAKINQTSAQDLKGALNASDMNRIESNLVFIRDYMHSVTGVYIDIGAPITWYNTDAPKLEHLDRVRDSISSIRSYFSGGISGYTVLVSGAKRVDYILINAVERDMDLLYRVFQRVIESFKICGTFTSGQDIIL